MNDPGARKISVVFADDHPRIRARAVAILETAFHVSAAVENGKLALDAVLKLKPDVAVLDLSMPVMSGIEAARQILQLRPDTKVIFLTFDVEPEYESGASALRAKCVLKQKMGSDLLSTIEQWFPNSISSDAHA